MTDCYFDKKDWRACTAEVCFENRKLSSILLLLRVCPRCSPRCRVTDIMHHVTDGSLQGVLEAPWKRRAHINQGYVM
jgi:hypothetical protein